MATYKLDIFDLLTRLDSNRTDIFCQLTDEEKKAFAPLVVMRWMTGTSDEYQIIKLSEFVNPYVFSLGDHKHLLMRLLQCASSGRRKQYRWIALKGSKKDSKRVKVISDYFQISTREAKDYIVSSQEIISYAEDLGWQKSEISDLKKELDIK